MANYGLLDIVPENLLEDKHIRKITEVIDAALKDIYPETAYPALISRIDELDSDTIDSLAWQWHVDFYDEDLSLEVRRELVKKSIDYHRHMGTNYAVDGVIKTCFQNAEIQENWEYGGNPYCFKVITIHAGIPDEDELGRIVQAINSVKNTRSSLDGLGFQRIIPLTRYRGCAVSAMKSYIIGPPQSKDTVITIGALRCRHTRRLLFHEQLVRNTINGQGACP